MRKSNFGARRWWEWADARVHKDFISLLKSPAGYRICYAYLYKKFIIVYFRMQILFCFINKFNVLANSLFCIMIGDGKGIWSNRKKTGQAIGGFRTLRSGKRVKSRSAVHNSLTPCRLYKAAIRASWIAPPEMRPASIIFLMDGCSQRCRRLKRL